MHMSFWWDYRVPDYLFKGLSSKSVGGLVAMCVSVSLMAFAFEFLRYLQAKHRQKELLLRSQQLKTICPNETSTLLTDGGQAPGPAINITLLNRSLLYGADVSLWFLLQNLAYLLMLTVMLYNGWFFISAVIGGGLGYFVFGQMFMKINLQNCQIIRDTWCMKQCGEPETNQTNGESTPALDSSGASRSCHEITVNVKADCHT